MTNATTPPLKSYCKQNGLTVDELAAILGVKRRAIFRWAKQPMPVNRVLQIEEKLGLPRQVLRPDLFGEQS